MKRMFTTVLCWITCLFFVHGQQQHPFPLFQKSFARNFPGGTPAIPDSCFRIGTLLKVNLDTTSKEPLLSVSDNTPSWVQQGLESITHKINTTELQAYIKKRQTGQTYLLFPLYLYNGRDVNCFMVTDKPVEESWYMFSGYRLSGELMPKEGVIITTLHR